MKILSTLPAICLFMSLFITGTCIPVSAQETEITVSAAMSLKNAFEQIGKLYERRYNIHCVLNFAATGVLLKQIQGGAPVDVFASASIRDMDEAEQQSLIFEDTRVDFARNRVVLIVPASIETGLDSFEGLKSPLIEKIAVGNPKTVPAGRYARDVLDHYRLIKEIERKLILTENVRQVLDYVARAETDAGVVYATDAAVRPREVRVAALAPEKSHGPVVYPIAVVKGTAHRENAQAFVALVMSDESRAVLEKFGFQGN